MRCTRPPLLLALLLAACNGGGEADPIAAPHELRLELFRGAGMRVPVRPVGAPAGQPVPSDEPVIVRVSALAGADVLALPTGTGPALALRLPPVELHWRALDPWCEPLHAVTPLARGDTVHNYYVRPTVAGVCRMVVEGFTSGWPFDADTALVKFDPGPAVSFDAPVVAMLLVGRAASTNGFAGNAVDAYGNAVAAAAQPVTVTLTAGADVFSIRDTLITASREGVGAASVAMGTLTRATTLWGLTDLRDGGGWRVAWACYGLSRPGQAYTDSVHFSIDSAAIDYGSRTARGITFAVIGTLTAHEWRRGEPVRTRVTHAFPVFGAQRVGAVEWVPGELAPATATGYAGGSLCAPPGDGLAWERPGPARLDRR